MSVFVVDERHVKALAVAWARWSWDAKTEQETTEVARELLRENIRSVAYRYNEPEDARQLPGPVPTPEVDLVEVTSSEIWNGYRLAPVVVLKLVDCLEYQSCETPDYKDTKAWDLLMRVRGLAINRLPGYEEAPWEYRGGAA